jgi:hypothetical protein
VIVENLASFCHVRQPSPSVNLAPVETGPRETDAWADEIPLAIVAFGDSGRAEVSLQGMAAPVRVSDGGRAIESRVG